MSVELVKDLFKLDQMVGENIIQTIVEGDILVPDTKPDITRVLSTNGKLQISKKEALDNKIAVEGTTYFKILYVSDKGNQPLYSIDTNAQFKEDIDIEGLTSEMKVEVFAEVQHIDFTINNERKIGVKAVINLNGKGIEEKELEVTNNVEGLEDIQVLKESFKYTDIIGVNKSDTLVKDNFEMAEDDYEINEILKWDAIVLEKEAKITDGRVILDGIVNIDILYTDDDEENPLKVIKREVPFTHFVEVVEAFSDMDYKLSLSVDELYYDIKEDIRGERKIVDIEAVVNIEAKVMDTQSKEILVDAYSTSRNFNIIKKKIELNENIGVNKANVLLKETLDIPQSNPSILEVFSVNIKPILTDYNTLENKIALEGILEVTVLYKSLEDIHPLYSFVQELPFRHYVDIEGLKENMESEVKLFIQSIDYDIINSEQIEFKVNLGSICEAYSKKTIEVIDEIEELEEEVNQKGRPSLTIYFIQPEDSLWKVAKKYNTTVQRIMDTNKIEDPLLVKSGDHIIIEKVHNFKL